jgi:hypothetical protein
MATRRVILWRGRRRDHRRVSIKVDIEHHIEVPETTGIINSAIATEFSH